MLGSAQVLVEQDDGRRFGYSGDFAWPLGEAIQVEGLVVDATYGKPTSIRHYSQAECNERLLELTSQNRTIGPVHILAHRGTLHRALVVLTEGFPGPILVDQETMAEINVYRKFGASITEVLDVGETAARELLSDQRYVWIGRPTRPVPSTKGDDTTTIKLSAFFSRPDAPVVELGPRSFSVALSDHADFDGTVDYVEATGARVVITDNTRGAGVDLALALKSRLGIDARPSSNAMDRD